MRILISVFSLALLAGCHGGQVNAETSSTGPAVAGAATDAIVRANAAVAAGIGR